MYLCQRYRFCLFLRVSSWILELFQKCGSFLHFSQGYYVVSCTLCNRLSDVSICVQHIHCYICFPCSLIIYTLCVSWYILILMFNTITVSCYGAVVVVIVRYLDLQLSMQSVPIVSSNPTLVPTILDTTLCGKYFPVPFGRSVVFSGFLHQYI